MTSGYAGFFLLFAWLLSSCLCVTLRSRCSEGEQEAYPLTSKRLHLFEHVWPVLRPFSLYHLYHNAREHIFDVTLLLQNRMSALQGEGE